MKKYGFWLTPIALVFLFSSFFYGCGQSGGGSSGTYTISGRCAAIVSGASVGPSAALPVTHIVAIGANNEKFLATLSTTEGTFSLTVNKGWPYAIGFYNQNTSTNVITLLGYLKQDDVDWHSLPLMAPAGSATDLGSVEVDAASKEAVPSINITSLIAQMNMTSDSAQLYGKIDGPMVVFTNVDIDGNGVFDFQESKGYQLQQFVQLNSPNNNLGQMLNGYYDYPLNLWFYQFSMLATDAPPPALGTSGSFTFPAPLSTTAGTSAICTGEVKRLTSSSSYSFDPVSSETVTAPSLPPPGTYTVEVGSRKLTFKNFQGCSTVALGNTEKVIYPVFSIVLDGAYVKTVNYKWKIVSSGTARDATAAELQAAVLDTSTDSTFVDPSPVLSFDPLTAVPIYFSRDGGSLDLRSENIKYADVTNFICHYNLTSRVRCMVDFKK